MGVSKNLISQETVKKYALNKPTPMQFFYGIIVFTSVLGIMLLTTSSEFEDALFFGSIFAGIMVGISLSLTKNIFFPIIIITSYNLLILSFQIEVSAIDVVTTIGWGIAYGLYISFVIYWVISSSQLILAKIKKLEHIQDEPITNKKFIFGSIIAGTLFGLLMVVSSV